METLQSKVTQKLKKECSCFSSIYLYMKHIIVQADNPEHCKELKQEITRVIGQYFPEREEVLPFILTCQGLKDDHFHIERKLCRKEIVTGLIK
ncbi:MAG: hypothetical protein EOP45_09495 [Sphingobacteriaceae bacterium]|nr:MAG: hypothetical protein EOP45_09495 [Sphingobacteriaceae bacterium]